MYSETGTIYKVMYNVKISKVARMVKYVQDAMKNH